MPPETSESVLGQLAFMRDFSAEQLERLAALAEPVRWGADEVIFRQGSQSAIFYVVRAGRVAIELAASAREQVTILTVGPGEVFGWSSLLANRPKFAAARAVTATEAYAFDAVQLRALCDADPCLGYALTRRLLSALADRLKGTRIQLLDLFASPAHHDPLQGELH